MRVSCDLELIWPHLLYGTMIGLEYDIHSLKPKPPPFSFLLIISFFIFFMYSCSLAHERICYRSLTKFSTHYAPTVTSSASYWILGFLVPKYSIPSSSCHFLTIKNFLPFHAFFKFYYLFILLCIAMRYFNIAIQYSLNDVHQVRLSIGVSGLRSNLYEMVHAILSHAWYRSTWSNRVTHQGKKEDGMKKTETKEESITHLRKKIWKKKDGGEINRKERMLEIIEINQNRILLKWKGRRWCPFMHNHEIIKINNGAP